jgi:tRNA dimethylallyltransferase
MQVSDEEFDRQRELARTCWYLTGATASGKSAIAMLIAEALDAEIISLDSMAIYQDMDIGTAKPNLENRKRCPHHLIDIVEPPKEFSVNEYCDAAFSKIREIQNRGKKVLFVGGTALYLKTILRGAFQGPPADWDFRNAILKEIKDIGSEHLIQRLQQVDPLSAHKLHPNDTRRIIRALEVYKTTGVPISHMQTQFDESTNANENRAFALRWPREHLHDRIDRRVEQMFARGFIDEVKGLREKYGQLGRTASQAVGYREVCELLDEKVATDEVIQLVKNRTHQFARHQETWFRGLSEVRWIERSHSQSNEQVAEEIVIATSG